MLILILSLILIIVDHLHHLAHPHLGHDDVQEGADHNHEVKVVPGVFDILSEAKSSKLDDKLKGKEGGEHQVHEVEELCVGLRLEGEPSST